MNVAQQETVVIPDLHGHVHRLEDVLTRYGEDMHYVLTGDYVDGQRTRETLELIDFMVGELGSVAVKGNHEWTLHAALEESDPTQQGHWRDEVWRRRTRDGYDGYEGGTVSSYGVDTRLCNRQVAAELREVMDELGHLDLLRNMPLYVEAPDFIAVHAGVTADPWGLQKKQLDCAKFMTSQAEQRSFSAEPVQLFDERNRQGKVPIYASSDTLRTDVDKTIVTGHAHISLEAEDRITDNGKRVRLASKINNGEPLFIWQSWDKQVVAIE